MSICILNYGSGNVKSVYNAFKEFDQCFISNNPKDLEKATHIVLPGVGSYRDSMDRINENLPVEELLRELKGGKPFLGICVGMQVLSSKGIEFVEANGLDLIPGTVSKLHAGSLPLPHVGWNNLIDTSDSLITRGLTPEDDFYFTHSYGFSEIANANIVASAEYGMPFPAIIAHENIYGVQFHPEKSQKSGFKLLKNFLDIK